MTKTSNPFKNPYRLMALAIVPIAAGVAALAIAVLGDYGWTLKGYSGTENGVIVVTVGEAR